MYSGTTLTKMSGRLMGGHQKIDRVARNHLAKLLKDNSVFPKTKAILQFEGRNGPDAIKRKSPAKDEPWHYFSPFDENDSQLIELINGHYQKLVQELKAHNNERVAFEAAWLAHAIVDGLTPAHHYPYEKKLLELRGGEGLESRNSIKEKIVMPGVTTSQKVRNNWKMWGPKGLFTTHGLFEMGVATIIAPLGFGDVMPNKEDLKELEDIGLIERFKHTAREIAVLDMYGLYYKKGWTPKLAYQVRHRLGPAMVQMVTLAWYSALIEAGLVK
ncbi:MAG TPA: hypothetical protein VLF39_01485 [Candidatus Saccharimonadales bacterium]|nr:hypothetical protein [Candidatus Saccharimonadales bacterium]